MEHAVQTGVPLETAHDVIQLQVLAVKPWQAASQWGAPLEPVHDVIQ